METPIADFVRSYANAAPMRLHMPGHKGCGFVGCEELDITEVQGADALYEAEGIIAQSEENAASLFGSGRTVYSTEGSSQCIRAMLYLALTQRTGGKRGVIVAARNVHRAFVYAAALLDVDVVWLWPEEQYSLCGCPITADSLRQTLESLPEPPAAVYVTSPDYLGAMADISSLAEVCHRHGTWLLVDNAHGAYLRFLPQSVHPLDLGADLCCDSAHKTLPVLTGGAYLHAARHLPKSAREQMKTAMAMFGSTSPSYLTLMSLDLCNRLLAGAYRAQLEPFLQRLEQVKSLLRENGWQVCDSDPLRLTLGMPQGVSGTALADALRQQGAECEYADGEYLVMMLTPQNSAAELARLPELLGVQTLPAAKPQPLPRVEGEQVCTIRQALFSQRESVAAEQAVGRICGAPTVACPPAIPIAVSGQRIDAAAVALFHRYGIQRVDVLKEDCAPLTP